MGGRSGGLAWVRAVEIAGARSNPQNAPSQCARPPTCCSPRGPARVAGRIGSWSGCRSRRQCLVGLQSRRSCGGSSLGEALLSRWRGGPGCGQRFHDTSHHLGAFHAALGSGGCLCPVAGLAISHCRGSSVEHVVGGYRIVDVTRAPRPASTSAHRAVGTPAEGGGVALQVHVVELLGCCPPRAFGTRSLPGMSSPRCSTVAFPPLAESVRFAFGILTCCAPEWRLRGRAKLRQQGARFWKSLASLSGSLGGAARFLSHARRGYALGQGSLNAIERSRSSASRLARHPRVLTLASHLPQLLNGDMNDNANRHERGK